MIFTWPVIEADRFGPGMADGEHTDGRGLLLPDLNGCCTSSSEMVRLSPNH